MSKVIDWLKTATTKVFDPDQPRRVAALAEEAWRQLSEQRRQFDFGRTMAACGAEPQDVPLVAERVYETALGRAWQDSEITPTERRSLDVVAELLRLDPGRRAELERRAGLRVFEQALGQGFADGVLDTSEADRLARVASSLGTTTRTLVTHCFAQQGEALLRAMFTGIMQGRTFSPQHWQRVVQAAQGLGLTEAELRQSLRSQTQQYVEHVLADAKADGQISLEERQTISWLMDLFDLPPAFRAYVHGEVATVDLYAGIRAGRLPAVRAPHLQLRAGEIVHHLSHAAYTVVRQLKSGPRADRHEGQAAVTDARLLFASPTKTVELSHRRVVSLLPAVGGSIEVRCGGSGAGYYTFYGDPTLARAVYEAAVGKANRTIVQQGGGAPSRHIPQEVRQRVWQQYGGRCAECGADQYLEFDHIIPVAKGGSSGETNVQLLCRGCNLKKSDRI